MQYSCCHDRQEIAGYLEKNIFLHIYSVGDLDDFFWPYTVWYAWRKGTNVEALALLYVGQTLPTLLALCEEKEYDAMTELLRALGPVLPCRFYTHLSANLEGVLRDAYELTPHGAHYKMALVDPNAVTGKACADVVQLTDADLPSICTLFRDSYPGNWFDARMLQTGQYFGLRMTDTLVSIAGVHVYSPAYKVAALGNITTHPGYRNRGLGTRVTARLCQSLLEKVDHIGLNVKADNQAAISCYERLGFKVVASYGEFMAERRT